MARGVGFDRGLPRAPGTASVWPTGQVSQQQVPHSQVWLAFGGGGRGGLLSQTGPQQQTLGRKPGSLPGAAVRRVWGTGGRGDLNFQALERLPIHVRSQVAPGTRGSAEAPCGCPVHTAGPSRETEDGLTCLFDRQSDRERSSITGSLPRCPQEPGLGQGKARSPDSIRVSPVGAEAQARGPSSAPCRAC